MISASIFREYDIRGIVGEELHEQSVKLLGYHLGLRLGEGAFVAVGYDARTHSPQLRDWLVSGFNAAGCRVLDMGMVPTPVNYFANYQPLRSLIQHPESGIQNPDALPDASVMITGSHNPPEYNGFKITVDRAPFFAEQIYTLGEEIRADQARDIPDDTKRIEIDAKGPYAAYMLEQFADLKGLGKKIVVDCGNGVAGTVLPEIFDALELDWEGLYCTPDGSFPNHHPDPSVKANLADLKAAMSAGADLGFAYDGDADRVAVLTRKRNIKGDELALLYTLTMERPTVIGEVKCSQLMYDELERRGARAIMYKTGHSNLKVKIQETGADLACEVSGHIFFAHRYFGFDDALYATLRFLELIRVGIDPDAELDALPKLHSTEEIKVETTEEEKFPLMEKIGQLLQNPPAEFPEIRKIITVDGVRIHFSEGWALVRASNTTPVLVTRFEATSLERVKEYEARVNALIERAKRELSEG